MILDSPLKYDPPVQLEDIGWVIKCTDVLNGDVAEFLYPTEAAAHEAYFAITGEEATTEGDDDAE